VRALRVHNLYWLIRSVPKRKILHNESGFLQKHVYLEKTLLRVVVTCKHTAWGNFRLNTRRYQMSTNYVQANRAPSGRRRSLPRQAARRNLRSGRHPSGCCRAAGPAGCSKLSLAEDHNSASPPGTVNKAICGLKQYSLTKKSVTSKERVFINLRSNKCVTL
jgi:hypothetical protein